ncbi:CinA family nicotinamide mononucleotide deamidase-related protein [Pseudocolwellia sp. HL-MZ7]|uniref:CinA family nicotinamide mononucleotide deamidase-related protein n=1 Tax=Pseudocolwellia sp. HL-MZ7 TaxID=3400627 RepID=UPI003CECDF37
MSSINLQLLLTGNELVSGDVIDTNSAYVAKQIKALGLDVSRRVTISDNLATLISEIQHMSKLADILIINGGLGPTTDDLTAEALAIAADLALEENPKAIKHLQVWAEKRELILDQANLKQAILPKNCQIIHNRTGSAVGIHLNINDCDIFCTPGVPSELKIMLNEEIIPLLKSQLPNQELAHTTRFLVFGIGESKLQMLINENFPDLPKEIEIGYRANSPTLELKLTSYTKAAYEIKTLWLPRFHELLNDHILGEIEDDSFSLPSCVYQLLLEKKLTITTAESCTGGLIASQITEIAGSSQIFEAGFVTYSNEMKTEMIGVPKTTLDKLGAVSKETVIAMAKGALAKSHADIAVAVSGIAGPTGGTPDKPTGTVWIAWGDSSNIHTQHFVVKGERNNFQRTVAARCLDLVRRFLIQSPHKPLYVK